MKEPSEAALDKSAEKKKEAEAAPVAAAATPEAPAPAIPAAPSAASAYTAQAAEGAAQQRAAYDAYAQNALGSSPADAMAKAQSAAQQTAETQANQAIAQSVKGAKTSGAMGGQAALAGSAQAATGYNAGLASGQQQYFDTTKLGATLGSEMSNRLQSAGQTEAGLEQSRTAAETSRYGIDKAAEASERGYETDMFGNIIGTVGAVAGLFSDKRLKEDIRPDKISDGLARIKAYSFKYKGNPRQERGVMAQDLEKTPMETAVVETPKGKMVDTSRLSTLNTAALSEHEKRLQGVEKLIKALGDVKRSK